MRVGKQAKGQGTETGLPRGSKVVGSMDKKWDRDLTKNGTGGCLKMSQKPRPKMGQRSDQKWTKVLTKTGAKV